MIKIAQNTPFLGDTIKGANGKKYVLLNKMEEATANIDGSDGTTQYVADGYEISGVCDVKLFLHQQISDTLYFKSQRGEATQEEWMEKVAEIKALVI